MSYLRHPSRQVLLTIGKLIEDALEELGWDDEATTPAGAPAVTTYVGSSLPHEKAAQFRPGTVYVTLGGSREPDDEELGGPLVSQEFPVFIDVVMDKDAHVIMLSDDLWDVIRGRLYPGQRHLPIIDFGQTPAAATDWIAELQDLERIQPALDSSVHWHSIHVSALIYVNEVHSYQIPPPEGEGP